MNSNPPVILTAAMMRACDQYTIDTLGIPSQILMESAARCVGQVLTDRRDLFPTERILVLCGSGNNGGDGLALARFLSDGTFGKCYEAMILYLGPTTATGEPDTSRMSQECARQYHLSLSVGLQVQTADDAEELLRHATCVVDAVFGIGLDRPIAEPLTSVLNQVRSSKLPVLAVDIPSGIHADTGEILGVALPAQATVTMQSLKAGLLLYPGTELCGEIFVCDIGISLTPVQKPYGYVADDSVLRHVLLPRRRRTHKGTYGRLTLLCGSTGMSGAAILATQGALRSGVGLAHVVTSPENRTALQVAVPEAIVSTYETPDEASRLDQGDALVIGCGFGTTEGSERTLRAVLEGDRSGTRPTVVDADGLNLLASRPSLWNTSLLSSRDKQAIITPHPAEMARICGMAVQDVLQDLPGTARTFAQKQGVTVVLKDAHTVIASPDGSLFLCTAGNAGMATGGCGDVLAGVIGSLLVQNRHRLGKDLTVAEVAAAAVFLHASAGDLAAQDLGEYSVLPSDLINRIPLVCRTYSDTQTAIHFI